jgi:hypothetical protein
LGLEELQDLQKISGTREGAFISCRYYFLKLFFNTRFFLSQACMGVEWHPVENSKLASAG